MSEYPLNPNKRPIKWAKCSVLVVLNNNLVDTDLDVAIQLAAKDVENRFTDTLTKWEEQKGGEGILYVDQSGVDEERLFQANAIQVRTDIHIDLNALDENTRTIQGYVNEGVAKFNTIMSVYKTGIARGRRKARRSISDYAPTHDHPLEMQGMRAQYD